MTEWRRLSKARHGSLRLITRRRSTTPSIKARSRRKGSVRPAGRLFLQAVSKAGYAVVGTWPMRTEKPGRMISVGTNALANSVVLVCRTKQDNAETIGRAEFIRALKHELPPAIGGLQKANISPADMPQSAIGPGMGVFSRYKAVLEADDSPDDREDRVATHQPRTRRVSGWHPGASSTPIPASPLPGSSRTASLRATTVLRTALPRHVVSRSRA